jgi:hypothetical protein
METDFANIDGMYKTNSDIVKKAIAEISPADWFRRPGDDSNHLMWVTGHLIWSRENVLKSLNSDWAAPWSAIFARGGKLATQDEYPGVEEMKRTWDDVSDKIVASLADAPADLLAKKVTSGRPSFDGKVSGLIAFLAFHETYHVGQISYLRKWLGYGRSVG